jgi:hypothetical protein
MPFTFRRQRERESEADYAQRRDVAQEAHEQRERELDEWDALMAEAHEITRQAETLACGLALGTTTLGDVQDFLATDHGNAYADLTSLQWGCIACGLDPATGEPTRGG